MLAILAPNIGSNFSVTKLIAWIQQLENVNNHGQIKRKLAAAVSDFFLWLKNKLDTYLLILLLPL